MQTYLLKLKNDTEIEVEQIRFCTLSSGYRIGVFRNIDARSSFVGRFVLVVKQGRQIIHQHNFYTLVVALQTYLDYICRYA